MSATCGASSSRRTSRGSSTPSGASAMCSARTPRPPDEHGGRPRGDASKEGAPMSFRARLTLAYLALLTLALSAFGFGVYTYVDARVHQEFEASFLNQARTFGQLVQGYYNININNIRSSLTAPGTYYVVSARHVPAGTEHPNINLPSPALGTNDLPAVPADRKVHTVPKWDNQLGTTLAVYTVDFEAKKAPDGTPSRSNPPPDSRADPVPRWRGRLVLARDLGSVESSLSLLRKILIAGGVLRPLARMKSTAQRIGDDRDFTRRMPVDHAKDELGRLSTSFNQMLTELEQSHVDLQTALESQRRFVADASHELRTPMTAIRTNVEFLARVPSRLAGRGVEVALGAIPEVWVSGDRDDLRRAVCNLVENALKYTQAGP